MALFSPPPASATDGIAIRAVHPDDVGRLRRILQNAFENENRLMGLRSTRLPTMTDDLLAYYLERSPAYSFVACGRGGAVGFALACRWGRTAWLGPIALLPPLQGKGWGRRLVTTCLNALRDDGVTTLGVETMPRSYRNLNFYTGLGMQASGMTFDLSRLIEPDSLSPPGGPPPIQIRSLTEMAGPEFQVARGRIRELSNRAETGLDYTTEADRILAHAIGEVLMLYHREQEEPVGCLLAHTRPYAREEIPGTVRVAALVLAIERGDPGPLLVSSLERLERWLVERRGDALIVRVPERESVALAALRARGYRISHANLRLCLADAPECPGPGTLHLNRWE